VPLIQSGRQLRWTLENPGFQGLHLRVDVFGILKMLILDIYAARLQGLHLRICSKDDIVASRRQKDAAAD
jgi:hypothetical protein